MRPTYGPCICCGLRVRAAPPGTALEAAKIGRTGGAAKGHLRAIASAQRWVTWRRWCDRDLRHSVLPLPRSTPRSGRSLEVQRAADSAHSGRDQELARDSGWTWTAGRLRPWAGRACRQCAAAGLAGSCRSYRADARREPRRVVGLRGDHGQEPLQRGGGRRASVDGRHGTGSCAGRSWPARRRRYRGRGWASPSAGTRMRP